MPGTTRIISIYNTQVSGNFSFTGSGGFPSVLVRPKASVTVDLLDVQLDDRFIDSLLPFVSGGQIEVSMEGVLLSYAEVVDLKYIATVGGREFLETQDEDVPVVLGTTKMNFTGTGVTATQDPADPNKVDVDIPSVPFSDHFVFVTGRGSSVTNAYLRTSGNVPTNLAGLVLPFNATITGLGVATSGNETWTAEVRKNNLVAVVTSTSMAGVSKQYEAKNVDVDAGDEIQTYCNGTGISRPAFSVFIKRR